MTHATLDRATVKGGTVARVVAQPPKDSKDPITHALFLASQYPQEGCVMPVPKDKEDKARLWGAASWQPHRLTVKHWLDHINHKHVIVTFAPDNAMAWDVDHPHTQKDVWTALRFLASHGLRAVATPSTSNQGWHLYAFFDEVLQEDAKDHAQAIKGGLNGVLGGTVDRVYPSGCKLTALGRHPLLEPSGKWLSSPQEATINQASALDSVTKSMGSRLIRWSLGSNQRRPRKKQASTKRSSSKTSSTTKGRAKVVAQPPKAKTPSTQEDRVRPHIKRDIRHALAGNQASDGMGLNETVNRLAHCKTFASVASCLASLYPKNAGYRHDLILRVAPLLYRFGLSEQEAVYTVVTIAKHAKDKDAKDRARAVATTFAKLEQGLPVCQVPSKEASKTAFCAVAWGVDLRSYRKEDRPRVAMLRVLTVLQASTAKHQKNHPITQEAGNQEARALATDKKTSSRPPHHQSTRAISEQAGITRKTVSKTKERARIKGLIDKEDNITTKGIKRIERLNIVLGVNTIKPVCDVLDSQEVKRLERYRNQHAIDRALYRATWHQEAGNHQAQEAQEAQHALLTALQEDPIDSKEDPITPSLATAKQVVDRAKSRHQPKDPIDTPKTAQPPLRDEVASVDPIDSQRPPHHLLDEVAGIDPIDKEDRAKVVAQPPKDPIKPKTPSPHHWLDSWLEHVDKAQHPLRALPVGKKGG